MQRARARTDTSPAVEISPGEARLLDAIGQAVIVTDLTGRILYWGRQAELLYGWSRAEALGRNVVEVTPADSSRDQAARIMSALAAGESYVGDFAVRRRDGSTFVVNVTDTPWRDARGRLVGIVGVSRALSDEAEATRHLRLLAEVARVLAVSADHEQTLRDAASVLVPSLADACSIFLSEDGKLRRVAEAALDAEREKALRDLRARPVGARLTQAIADLHGMGDVAVLDDAEGWVTAHGRDDPAFAAALRRVGPRSAVIAPVRIGARPVGALICATLQATGRRFTEGDVRIIQQIASRLAVAVETGRLRAEADATARRYRSFVVATSQVVRLTDGRGMVSGPLPGWAAFTGQRDAESRGRGWIDAIHPEDRAAVERAWRAAFEATTVLDVEYRLRRPDGSYTWVLDRGAPVTDSRGIASEWIGVITDISDKRRRESKLSEDRAIYETLYRIGRSLATELDEGKLLQRVTDEAKALAGAERAAFRFGPWQDDDGVVRSDDVRADPRSRTVPPDWAGDPPVVSYLAVPVVTRSGEVLGGLFFAHHEPARFTALHERLVVGIAGQAAIALENARLYARIRASEARARDADHRKDEFLAMLGHELRNPLAPIVTALDVLRMRGASGREHEVIERQVRHLTRLVDDLLDVSRITRGKVQLRRAPTLLGPIVARAIEMVEPLMEQRGHHLTTDLSADVEIEGDVTRLTQVFVNLLTNAAKYTPNGGHVHVALRESAGGAAVLIRDDGVGIDPDLLPRIFDPFVQSARPIDRAEGGLGIGLAIVKSVIDLHGGAVEVRSEGRGRGAEIEVTLPGSARPSRPPPSVERPSRTMRARRAGLRVLVVDDNADAADLLADALRHSGHEVTVAHDGPAALRVAPTFHPDVAVLDLGLPVMDGYELAERLRALLPGDVRVIAVTGYGQATDRERTRAAGFDEHLVKPIDLPELEAAIRGEPRDQ